VNPLACPMTITLKPEQVQFIQEQVALGRFQSADAVLAQALALLAAQSQDYEAWADEVGQQVDAANQEAQQGAVLPLETVMAQLQDKFRQAREH
jgi:antitoxin ParD1/3/4